MKKIFLTLLLIILSITLIILGFIYFFQEKLIFFPEKVEENFKFTFDQRFEEIRIQTADKKQLSGLLFKADSSRGLIFYLHGNAGSLRSWGEVAKTYTLLGYDVFMLDYRGYGKSEGSIQSEEQLFQDDQLAYDQLKNIYDENKIVVLGYSIGTGLAAKLASTNHPKMLILQAPFFNMKDLIGHINPLIPTFVLKYRFETNKFISECKMPVCLFHGTNDEVIYYHSSEKLLELVKENGRLISLEGQGHNGMSDNPDYLTWIEKVLSGL